MMPLKKPKLEEEGDRRTILKPIAGAGAGAGAGDEAGDGEDEEALVALIEHRTKEVETLRQKLSYYQSQLHEAEKRLSDSHSTLSRLRSRSNGVAAADIKSSPQSTDIPPPRRIPEQQHPRQRPQLVIPAPNTSIRHSLPLPTGKSSSQPSSSQQQQQKRDAASADAAHLSSKGNQVKRNIDAVVQREHLDLIPGVRGCTSPNIIRFHSSIHIPSQHKRKLRSLVLNPQDDSMFLTTALDGMVNLWHVQFKGPNASLLSSTDCLSPKQRKWPEDITWHPDGDRLFASYSADSGDSQVSILNLNFAREKRVCFLEEKPHIKGIINCITFMPWDDSCFATGGCDHAVILWHEKDGSWKPKAIHRNQHSSAVTGVTGLKQRKVVLSVGADKRIVAFDVLATKSEFSHQIDSKCMAVLPNPCDFNLFLVQSGTHGKQLRLFDIRLKRTELHAFGWQQESSESQSALINPAWSPDGWYVSSGSADPVIHIFDIRYDNDTPSQSVQAHQKRVFKAVWHESSPMLTSISSDLNIGLHKIG